MRIGLLIVGIILLALGAAMMFVPLVPQSLSFPATTTGSSGTSYEIVDTSFALLGTPASVSWSAPNTVDVFIVTCTNDVTESQLSSATTSAEFNSDCGTNATYGSSSAGGISYTMGTSGSESFTIPSGGSLIIFGSASSATTISGTLKTGEGTLGLLLLVIGLLLVIVGVVRKKKVKAPKGAPPPQPWGPGQAGQPGMAPAGAPTGPVQPWGPPQQQWGPPQGQGPQGGWQQPPQQGQWGPPPQ